MRFPCWSDVLEEQLQVVGSEQSGECHGSGRTAYAADFDDDDDDVDDEDFESDDPDFDVSLLEDEEEDDEDGDAEDDDDADTADEAVGGGRRRGSGR